MARLLFVVNNLDFFISHRLPIALAAKKQGYEVFIASPVSPGTRVLAEHQLGHISIRMTRSGGYPWQELGTFLKLLQIFRKLRPTIVHLVTIKPVLYGGIAARLAGIPAVVSAISGLGYLFVVQPGIRRRLLRKFVLILYGMAMGHWNQRVIFQNTSDRATLISAGVVSDKITTMIPGSGVELVDYSVEPEPEGAIVVVMASRLLNDKGVMEYVQAARELRARGIKARFLLAGTPDPGNPSSVEPETLDVWQREGAVEWLGHCNDIPALFARAHIVTLPSYYGEGLPKVLIEAAASGRPVVTTDLPGCRDAILPGKSGLLVKPRDSAGLANALLYLAENPEVRRRMGRTGRKLANREFSVEQVVNDHLAIYGELLDRC